MHATATRWHSICAPLQVNLVHGSERNLSGSRRLGLAIRYLAPSCRALPMENEEEAAPWDQASSVAMSAEVRHLPSAETILECAESSFACVRSQAELCLTVLCASRMGA